MVRIYNVGFCMYVMKIGMWRVGRRCSIGPWRMRSCKDCGGGRGSYVGGRMRVAKRMAQNLCEVAVSRLDFSGRCKTGS